MLTSDHGIVDEATDAQLRTEVSKLQETTDLYVRGAKIKRRGSGDVRNPSMQEELEGITTNVETTDGLHLGIYKSFKEVDFHSQFGKGGEKIEDSWTGEMLDLDDCFIIDFATNDIYYIVDGRIWKANGVVTVADIIEYDKNHGNNPSETSPKPTTSTTPSTKPTESIEPSEEPTISPTTSTEPTVEPTESTEPSEEPSTTPSTEPSPKFPTTPSPDPSWQDGPWEFEGFIDKNDENDGITEEEIKDPEIDEPEPDTEYEGVFSKEITVTRYVYDDQTRSKKELKDENGNNLTGKVYKTKEKETAAKIELGTGTEVTIKSKVKGTPRGWSKKEEGNTQELITNTEVELTTNETYYMSYEYTVTATYYYNNNVGDGGEEETAKAYMNYEGNKIGGLPDSPNAKQPGWTFRGWSTDYNSNAEDATEELGAITEDEMYYASYQKAYTATMYEYNNITSTVEGYKYKDYQNEESANPKVRLDSSGTSTIPEGFDIKYGWSKDDETVNATKTADVGGIVTLEQATENNYYMIYSKAVKVTFDSNEGEDGTVTSRIENKYTNYKNETPKAASIQMPIEDESPTRDNYELEGWGTDGTTKEYDIGQTYEFTEDKTVKAVWKQTLKPVDPGKITEEDAGKSVEYETTAGIKKWLPFYQETIEGKNVLYLVAYDYALYHETYMSKTVTGLNLGEESQYSVYWPLTPSANATLQVTNWWKKYTFGNVSNENSKCAGSLLNSSAWEAYKGDYGTEAIGSPSLEMYVEAYNNRYKTEKLTYGTGTNGLTYGGSPGTKDRAFCIPDQKQCANCWLASPYSNPSYTSALPVVAYNGSFNSYYHGFTSVTLGLRPVVRLKPGIKIVEMGDGSFQLDYSKVQN